MVISIEGKEFCDIVQDVINNKKVLTNFQCNGRTLTIQTIDSFILQTPVPCKSIDSDFTLQDITVYIEPVIKIIKSTLPVEIDIRQKNLSISQGIFKYSVSAEFEARREIPYVADNEFNEFSVNRLKYIVSLMKKLDIVAKSLKVSIADNVFNKDRVYTVYTNIALVEKISFEDIVIPHEELRKMIFIIDTKAKYYYDKKQNIIIFKSGRYTILGTTLFNANINMTTNVIDEVIERCSTKLTTVSFIKYINDMDTIFKIYKNHNVSLSICENDILITVNSTSTSFAFGNDKEPLATITVLAEYIKVISEVFKDDKEITVSIGGNVLCLQTQTKTLLISGVIF